MQLRDVPFINNDVEPGWRILDETIPLGTRFTVDLDRIGPGTLTNLETGQTRRLLMIWTLARPEAPGEPGWLPLIAFTGQPPLDASA